MQSLAGKTTLVTGANAGIGYYTALGLAKAGAEVILLCRTEAKAKAAREAIQKATGNDKLPIVICDLASQKQVREAAAHINATFPQLHILINNAGLVRTELEKTEEGIEMNWAVNHLSHFLLTNLLLDKLKASAPARIITVSSVGHRRTGIHFDDINLEKGYKVMRAYGQSKLGNVLFTYELARRLQGTGVTANVLHPGGVKTQIGNKGTNKTTSRFWSFLKPFMISEEKGAATSLYLAMSPDVQGTSGKYWQNCKEKASHPRSHNMELQRRTWALSEQMTGLDQES